MNKADKNYLLIIIAGLLLYVPFLGRVHLFDWDEINFAEAAREMIVTGNYLKVQINFLPFWEKPPLFIWMQVLSMKVFGVNEFAARFPNAVVGVVTLLLIYYIGKKLLDKRMGLWWVLAYAGSILPQFYFKSGIIDPTFNLFIFCSIYFLFQFKPFLNPESGKEEVSIKPLILSGLFISLAVLTKGPVALIILFLCWLCYVISQWYKANHLWYKQYITFIITVLIVSCSWFVVIGLSSGWSLLGEFIYYQYHLLTNGEAGHSGPFYYHFVVLLVGCIPASAALFMLRKNKEIETTEQQQFRLWMIILFAVTLILFSIVKTKIVHYSSLCYFPLSFLAAFTLYQAEDNLIGKKMSALIIALIGLSFSVVLIALPFVGNNIDRLIPYIKDPFAQANMQAQVSWPYSLSLIGVLYFAVVVAGVILLVRNKAKYSFITFFVGTIVIVQLASYFIVPRIEAYSQRAAIDFYQSKANEDCYIETYGFKSYGYLFYAKKRIPTNPNHSDIDWLLKGKVDKPVYIVGKITSATEIEGYKTLEKIGEKNGFVFYKRN